MGINNVLMPSLSYGYIYLPAVFGISITSVFAAQYGARLAHFVSTVTLKRLMLSLMITIAIYMIVI